MPSLTTPDGLTLTWHERGSGPALVLHSGGPGCSSRYFGRLPELEAERTLLLIDPRGTGESGRPSDPSAYNLEDHADDLEALREHLGLERLDLVGHSHGGFVAMCWAGRHPGSVGRLVLANTTPRFTDEIRALRANRIEAHRGAPYFDDALEALEARRQGRYSNDEELSDLFVRDWRLQLAPEIDYEPVAEALRAAGNNADALRHFNDRVAGTMDLRPMLERIAAPTLVLASDLDPFAAAARETADHLPDATIVALPDADHFTFLEHANRTAWSLAILSFLKARG
jgi:pimeloyl-ACP methyl ester carboxylesterase